MGTNPTQPRRRRKLTPPDKPYPEFPLGYHASGKFIKKINKQIYYFGAWAKRVNKELVLVEDGGWKAALDAVTKRKLRLRR